MGSLAIAPGGQIIYAATANGGVFRSGDGGTTWKALRDAFNLDPTNFASDSLACGGIAIDPADPNRVYVGTGEGDIRLSKLNRHLLKLPSNLSKGEVSALERRLSALGGARQPLPKGPMPQGAKMRNVQRTVRRRS